MAADEGERKLAAILAADVAGYSRLMGDDERATVASLKLARQVFKDRIEAHAGRLIDTTGDSVLAEFKSVVEAVQCAVEVQERLGTENEPVPEHRKMHFRIGINLGDIIEEDDGTIYGDGVNVAARLEALAEPGGIMVSESAHMQVEGKLDIGLADAGEHEVKNIAKPVRAWRVLPGGSAPVSSAKTNLTAKLIRRPKVVAGLAVGLAVLIGLAVWGLTIRVEAPQMVKADGTPTDDPVLAVPTGPTIAVLPFLNLSGDPEQDYFADGISEDVLNQISPAMGLQVISRASSFRFRGSNVDASKVGAELGAQFLVLGSVRRTEKTIRVMAELVEVETGKKVWSNAYDRALNIAELFEMQDDITQSIVAAIADEYGVISQLTRQRARDGEASLGSYECILRAYHYFEYFNEANHLLARDCLEEAVQRDPQYAEAWGWLAILYANEHLWTFNLRDDPLGRSLHAGNTAVGADRHSQMAWEGKAAAHYFRGEREEFHRAAQQAISMNPNDVSTIGNIAWYYGNLGEFDLSLPLMDKALSLSPFPPVWYYQPHWLKYYMDGDFEVALQFAIKAEGPFWYPYLMLASTHAELGNETQAANNIRKLLEARPDIVDIYHAWAKSLHWPSDLIEKVATGLGKAGLQIPDEIGIAD